VVGVVRRYSHASSRNGKSIWASRCQKTP
jgi:hypothetical protein